MWHHFTNQKITMSDDYLANTREKSLRDDSNVSEAELHATHENILEVWEQLQDCKLRKAKAVQEAIAKVDADFNEELKGLESQYAMALMLSR